MKESVLQYVWQHKLFVQHGLTTTDGQNVKVIDVGKLNTDGGPDFFNAKVMIGSTLWAGNVEIHVNSSDWKRHHHQQDDAYNNVILHVVKRADQEIMINGRRRLPQLELKFPESIEQRFEDLVCSQSWLPCSKQLDQIPQMLWVSWINALVYERLAQKVEEVHDLLLKSNFNFDEVFFRVLARSFGFSINQAAFDALASSIPWHVVMKCRNSLQQTEALLLGQSGLLFKAHRNTPTDTYLCELVDIYRLLQRKYGLIPIPASSWRWLRLRPENFPDIRIAQLSAMLHQNEHLFSDLMRLSDLEGWMDVLGKSQVSEYWQHHLMAGVPASKVRLRIGAGSLAVLIINAVIPVGFGYSEYLGDARLKELMFTMLDQLPAENNVIIRNWKKENVSVNSAADTQALIQLYRKYCEPKNCLRCRIGHKVLTIA